MLTQSFTLTYGLKFDGKIHTEGELRLPTVGDLEAVLESTTQDACKVRLERMMWARILVRFGDIPKENITPELLTNIIDSDYVIILEAENTLRKKP